jgi:hypothetical protein
VYGLFNLAKAHTHTHTHTLIWLLRGFSRERETLLYTAGALFSSRFSLVVGFTIDRARLAWNSQSAPSRCRVRVVSITSISCHPSFILSLTFYQVTQQSFWPTQQKVKTIFRTLSIGSSESCRSIREFFPSIKHSHKECDSVFFNRSVSFYWNLFLAKIFTAYVVRPCQ